MAAPGLTSRADPAPPLRSDVMTDQTVTFDDVRAAAERLDGVIHRTPSFTSATLDDRLGARVTCKAESLQRTGSFKIRGAYNAISQLSADELDRGVIAYSSGNHAQAVALAARLVGTTAVVVMPEEAPTVKRAATEGYGAEVVTYRRPGEEREDVAARIGEERGLVLIPPFDHPDVIAGQGTVAVELIEDGPALDTLVVPVSGGGLIGGCAIASASLSPSTRVVGVEPEGADDTRRSLLAGERIRLDEPRSIADGLVVKSPGELTFPIIRQHVDEVVTVTEEAIIEAVAFLLDRMKLVVEPSGAVGIAALLTGARVAEGSVGVVLSGGNVGTDGLVRLLGDRR